MSQTVVLTKPAPESPFSRADLEFRGVDHTGPSFEVRVFLDNAAATPESNPDDSQGYAGSFYVFGHGGCFGETGHCDIREGTPSIFDLRLAHPLTPAFKTVVITGALQRLLQTSDGDTFQVTVVPVIRPNPTSIANTDDPLKFESVSLITYEDPVLAGLSDSPTAVAEMG
jgi:hypothetical protein